MRLLNFFKLLNKKTDGHFAIISILTISFILNIVITVNGYGIIEYEIDKPYSIYLLLTTILHGFVLLMIWMVGTVVYYRFILFIKNTVIPLWEEAADERPTQKPGGKIKF